jgi:hypothetical protein
MNTHHQVTLPAVFNPPESTQMSALTFHLAAASLILIAATTTPFTDDAAVAAAYWSLLPIVGALGAAFMAFLLNRVSENRPAVAGRVVGAMMAGVGLPRLLTFTHPWVKTLTMDPIILIMLGFICGLFGYAGARALVDRFFKLAPGVVNKQVDQLADVVAKKTVDKLKDGDQTARLSQ